MRTSLFLGLTGLALLAACGLSGCSDDGVENKDPQLPPPQLMSA